MVVDASEPMPSTPKSKSKSVWSSLARQEVQLLICALGIYACYLRYGLLQERIYTAEHGPDGEKYSFSLFLVAIQTATNAFAAFIVLALGRFHSSSPKPTAPSPRPFGSVCGVPLLEYFLVSLSYLSAMTFSFTALNYMSYPMQALGKSCKMIPVMLMGVVIRRKRYNLRDYLCVFLITIGVAVFSWKSSKSAVPTSPLGFALLFASLFMDGVTGPLQERLVSRHSPSSHQLMFWQNVCAVIWLSFACLVTGEGYRAVNFVMKYPDTLRDIMAFSTVSALGQNFIFYTVRNFSALTVTTITTTRKMFTVLLSIFVNKHAMVARQWLGMVLVFVAITWEAAEKQRSKAAKAKAKAESSEVSSIAESKKVQ